MRSRNDVCMRVDRDAARPNLQRAIGIAAPGQHPRQVAVLDNPQLTVDRHHVAHPFQRVLFANHLRGKLRLRQEMIAQELGAQHVGQRIIDLEIKQRFRRRGAQLGQAPLPAKAASIPPWPSGLTNRWPGIQQYLSALRIDGRHRALAENRQVFRRQPKPLVPREIFHRLLVRGGTGHQAQRHAHAVAPRATASIFSTWT